MALEGTIPLGEEEKLDRCFFYIFLSQLADAEIKIKLDIIAAAFFKKLKKKQINLKKTRTKQSTLRARLWNKD